MAPSDGRIGVRLIDPGNMIRASDSKSLATLVLNQPSAVLFTLPATSLGEVREAMKRGPVEVTAFDQNNRIALATGKLLLIDNVIDQGAAAIRLKALFPNDDEALWPGDFVNASMLVETRRNALVVPGFRRPERAAWAVHLGGCRQQHGRAASHRSGTGDRRCHDHRFGPHRGRARRHGGPVQAAGKGPGGDGVPATRIREREVNLSEPFIRRPVATSLMAGALAFLGLAAFPFLPVAPLPQVDFPTVLVTATLAGASAETMATSVATPLERQIGQIAGITEMTSFSALGATSITVQFDLNRNIDLAAQDVQAAITAASKTLPQTMTAPPTYKKLNPADAPILILSARSDTLPITVVDEYADSFLAQQISQVTGVALVSLGGEQRPAIRIQVDPAKLAARGLTLEEIRGALVNATTNAPKGSLTTARTSLTIEANDQIVEPKPFDDVIIAYRNGAPVRVRDIGRAVAAATDRFSAAYHDDAQAILLSVYKQPGANIIGTVEHIKSLLPKLAANIPAAMRLDTVLDRTTTIRASVFDVEFTLALTVVLVVLVVLLFLRNLWATLVPAVTIVLSLLGSFAAMYAFNFSIDNLSLMALTIAIGFVVDDAIVEVENVYRHIEKGTSPLEAALTGSGEIRFTVLSISVSLIAVFIPLLLMSGIIGRLFREFALTVTASIVVSAFVSLTLAPMLCSRFMRPRSDRHGRLYSAIEAGFDALLSGYRRTLDIVLRHQAITLGVFFATMALSVVMMIQIPKGFFPIQDIGMLNGLAEAAQEVSPMEMMRLQRELGAVLLRDPDIAGFASQTGSIGGNGNAQSANTARFFIALKPREERTLTASQIINRLRPQFARVEGANMFLQATQDITVGGRAARGSFQYTLQDANIPELVDGRRRCSTRCARCHSLPMPQPISWPSRRVCG